MKWLFRKLRRWHNRVTPAPKPVPIEIDSTFKTVWGQIIPHEKHKSGANTWDKKLSEYVYGNLLVPLLKMLDADRTGQGVYAAALELFNQGCTASIETHFNAGGGKWIEILVLQGDKLSEMYARRLIKGYLEEYPERGVRGDNGIRWVTKGIPGYYNLINAGKAGMKIKILTEFFFGDRESDYITPEIQAKIINKVLIDI